MTLYLTTSEVELIVNALLFTSSTDVCIHDSYDFAAAAKLASRMQLPDTVFHAYLYSYGSTSSTINYEDVNISSFIETTVPNFPIQRI